MSELSANKTIRIFGILFSLLLLPYCAVCQSSWFQQHTISVSLNSIQMFEDVDEGIVGYVAGSSNYVAKLTDMGYSLTMLAIPDSSANFNDLFFVNPSIGWVTGTRGAVFATTDAGSSWEYRTATTTGGNITSIMNTCFFFDIFGGYVGWVGGSNGELWKTNNGGITWFLDNNKAAGGQITQTIFDIDFLNTELGYCVTSNGEIYRKESLGGPWYSEFSGTSEWLLSVTVDSGLVGELGWITGKGGTILRDSTLSDDWIDVRPAFLTTDVNAIGVLSEDEAYAVGDNGIVSHTTDAGQTWQMVELGTVESLNDIFVLNEDNVWIVGDNGVNFFSQGTVNFGPDSILLSDRFEIGTTKEISFETTFNSLVDIHFRSDSDTNWTLEVSQYPSSNGSYVWTMPSIPSTGYQLRIRSSQKTRIEAISQPFEIFEKTLDITAPLTGAVLTGGELFTIQWTYTNVDSVKLEFQERPNLLPILIVDSLPAGNLQQQWEVARTSSDQCRILISELDGSPIDSTDFFTIAYDNSEPVITIDPTPIVPRKGEDLEITATIADDNISSNTLFFRQGGDLTFSDSTSMASIGNNLYRATVPAVVGNFAIDERGFEFYIKSVDHSPDSNTSLSDTIHRPVSLDSSTHAILSSQPGTTEIYQMISIHYNLTDKNINTVLGDDLGAYDSTQWRVWHWLSDSEGYGELTKNDIGEFTRGKSFWIASVKNGFTSEGGQSYEAQDYVLDLQSGWNQIALPFAFPVRYEDIIASSLDTMGISQFWHYVHVQDYQDYQVVDMLEPQDGYFIKNMNQVSASLIIPAIAADRLQGSLARNLNHGVEWQIRLEARIENAIDSYNLVGASEVATTEWDRFDQPEPPSVIGKYVTLYFPHEDWLLYPDNYATDFRPTITNGQVWDFTVQTNEENLTTEIVFEGIESVPDEFEVYILDEKLKISQDLRENPVFRFPTVTVPLKKQLKLVVGNEGYLQETNLGINEIPKDYELSQNFPNPFNLATTIRYGIPTSARTTLRIFNVLGEEVVVLVGNEPKEAGYHVETWNGLDKRGLEAPSGIYFYRIEAATFYETKKMSLVK